MLFAIVCLIGMTHCFEMLNQLESMIHSLKNANIICKKVFKDHSEVNYFLSKRTKLTHSKYGRIYNEQKEIKELILYYYKEISGDNFHMTYLEQEAPKFLDHPKIKRQIKIKNKFFKEVDIRKDYDWKKIQSRINQNPLVRPPGSNKNHKVIKADINPSVDHYLGIFEGDLPKQQARQILKINQDIDINQGQVVKVNGYKKYGELMDSLKEKKEDYIFVPCKKPNNYIKRTREVVNEMHEPSSRRPASTYRTRRHKTPIRQRKILIRNKEDFDTMRDMSKKEIGSAQHVMRRCISQKIKSKLSRGDKQFKVAKSMIRDNQKLKNKAINYNSTISTYRKVLNSKRIEVNQFSKSAQRHLDFHGLEQPLIDIKDTHLKFSISNKLEAMNRIRNSEENEIQRQLAEGNMYVKKSLKSIILKYENVFRLENFRQFRRQKLKEEKAKARALAQSNFEFGSQQTDRSGDNLSQGSKSSKRISARKIVVPSQNLQQSQQQLWQPQQYTKRGRSTPIPKNLGNRNGFRFKRQGSRVRFRRSKRENIEMLKEKEIADRFFTFSKVVSYFLHFFQLGSFYFWVKCLILQLIGKEIDKMEDVLREDQEKRAKISKSQKQLAKIYTKYADEPEFAFLKDYEHLGNSLEGKFRQKMNIQSLVKITKKFIMKQRKNRGVSFRII